MLTKAEQIEELARLILVHMGWAGSRLLEAEDTASIIWNKGYRKVEKPLVLTGIVVNGVNVALTTEMEHLAVKAQRDADYLAMRGEE